MNTTRNKLYKLQCGIKFPFDVENVQIILIRNHFFFMNIYQVEHFYFPVYGIVILFTHS